MLELFLIKLTAKAVWYLAAFLVGKFPKRKGFKSFFNHVYAFRGNHWGHVSPARRIGF